MSGYLNEVDKELRKLSGFLFDPKTRIMFHAYYNECKDLSRIEFSDLDSAERCVYNRKLRSGKYAKYTNTVWLKISKNIDFNKTVLILKMIFGDLFSLFSNLYSTLKVSRGSNDGSHTYVCKLEKASQRFILDLLL